MRDTAFLRPSRPPLIHMISSQSGAPTVQVAIASNTLVILLGSAAGLGKQGVASFDPLSSSFKRGEIVLSR